MYQRKPACANLMCFDLEFQPEIKARQLPGQQCATSLQYGFREPDHHRQVKVSDLR